MTDTLEFGNGTIGPALGDRQRLEAYLPTDTVQNHASNVLPMPNGDLLCTWFAGTQEGMSDISIYVARLQAGTQTWSTPEKVSDDPARSEQNPVFFPVPDGKLWLMWTSQESGNQDSAVVMRRISSDGGYTWGPIELFIDTPGTFVRQPPVILENGDWLLTVFYCVHVPGQKWVGNKDYSAVKISSDQGKTWKEIVVPGSLGCVHMNIIDLGGGSLVAFFRSRWADHVYTTRSRDWGKTWDAAEPTELPNNNSSIQVCRLQNGHLAMVFNNMNAENCTERRVSLYDDIGEDDTPVQPAKVEDPTAKTAFWGAPRAPLSIALSLDDGKSWRIVKDLEVGDGYCMTNNSKEAINREYSYPSIKQSIDGKLHITYTYFRQRIKYVCIDESWILG
ncbi:MAG: exo-alpha-sialidase [Sphaerochaeta sp.]|jgi:predicted neuraminidase|nr:exo-alpha-sialidase [Sphaerochaeta sp.]PKL28088.1 MAG: glycosyl hydrolase [Spirochaetae bacterium HGW-Spirochaetae-2]